MHRMALFDSRQHLQASTIYCRLYHQTGRLSSIAKTPSSSRQYRLRHSFLKRHLNPELCSELHRDSLNHLGNLPECMLDVASSHERLQSGDILHRRCSGLIQRSPSSNGSRRPQNVARSSFESRPTSSCHLVDLEAVLLSSLEHRQVWAEQSAFDMQQKAPKYAVLTSTTGRETRPMSPLAKLMTSTIEPKERVPSKSCDVSMVVMQPYSSEPTSRVQQTWRLL